MPCDTTKRSAASALISFKLKRARMVFDLIQDTEALSSAIGKSQTRRYSASGRIYLAVRTKIGLFERHEAALNRLRTSPANAVSTWSGFRIAKCANPGEPEPVFATFAIELPVRTMLPLVTNIAPGFNEELVRYCCLMLPQVYVDLCVRKIA
jgi:hypothetical protein